MICALLTGRGGSKGIPNKNVYPILGRPLTAYPLLAAKHSKRIDRVFVSTDSKDIAEVGHQYGAETIWRPDELCTDNALHEDAIVHGYRYLKETLGLDINIIVILLCNCATITPGTIDEGIEILENNPDIDSCVTVSEYSEYNPARAMKIESGFLEPYMNPSDMGAVTCDRYSTGKVYYCDSGAYICRPRCMDLSYGRPPFRWMGRKTVPLIQSDGLDIDNERGIVATEYWLRKHQFDESTTPYGAV